MRLNIAWSVLLLLAFASLFVLGPTVPRALAVVAAVAYLAASRSALRGNRLAVAVTIVASVWFAVRWAPMVGLNAWMFATDHPLYLDSPGTILIVAIHAVLFALPGASLVLLYLFQWRNVRRLLAGGTRVGSEA